MAINSYIKRFGRTDRLFHIFLMLTFLIQTITGFGRLLGVTGWGGMIVDFLGGYETSLKIHQTVGIIMTVGFIVHAFYLIRKVNWRDTVGSIFGPDSIVPNFKDAKDMWENTLYIIGIRKQPRFDRWTYWEKFDYWAVFWGMPLLSITGFMLIYPLFTSRFLPGWSLNIASYFHRAEAVLAVSYIFIVHFFINHLKPTGFPMNETMFSGNVTIKHLVEEKPEWAARLKKEGKIEKMNATQPAVWFRVLYYIFGLTAVSMGVYLLICGIWYSKYIKLH